MLIRGTASKAMGCLRDDLRVAGIVKKTDAPLIEAHVPSTPVTVVGSTGPPQSWTLSVEAISDTRRAPSEPHRSVLKHTATVSGSEALPGEAQPAALSPPLGE